MLKFVVDFCERSQKCIKVHVWRVTLKNFDVVERYGSETAPVDHNIPIVLDDKMINNQRIWLKFSPLIKHLLCFISYKICMHNLVRIDFIASVYELFDNPRISGCSMSQFV